MWKAKAYRLSRVELSLEDDYRSWAKRAVSSFGIADKAIADAITAFDSAAHSAGVALDAAEKYEKMAKELGSSDSMKKAGKMNSFAKRFIKDANKAANDIKNAGNIAGGNSKYNV